MKSLKDALESIFGVGVYSAEKGKPTEHYVQGGLFGRGGPFGPKNPYDQQQPQGLAQQYTPEANPGVDYSGALQSGGLSSAPAVQGITAPTATPTVTPTPTQPPVPTPTLIPEAPSNPYMDLLKAYFPDEEVNNASNVMFRESGFEPLKYNTNTEDGGAGTARNLKDMMRIVKKYPKTDVGAFQVNNYWQRDNLAEAGYAIEDMIDPQKAIQYAAWLQKKNGWSPWYGADALGLTNR